MKREIDKIAAAIPHDELAIQFDVASAVFARLRAQRARRATAATKHEMQETLRRHPDRARQPRAGDIELLFHFCYGDSNHKHVVEPTDMGDMVEFANRLSRGVKRPIQLIHMPVPRDRADDAYFEPLRAAEAAAGDRAVPRAWCTTPTASTARGGASPRRRSTSQDFSIATECGFGRREPETIPELLRIHAAIADL